MMAVTGQQLPYRPGRRPVDGWLSRHSDSISGTAQIRSANRSRRVLPDTGRSQYHVLSRHFHGGLAMTATGTDGASVLGTAYERRSRLSANIFAGIVFVGGLILTSIASDSVLPHWATVAVCVAAAWLAWNRSLRKVRRRRKLLARPFPAGVGGRAAQGRGLLPRPAPEEQDPFPRRAEDLPGREDASPASARPSTPGPGFWSAPAP